jgi:predicted phosphate transport protein (TIGR00153 family)
MALNSFLQVFVPKDKKFIPLLIASAENLVAASETLVALTRLEPGDPQLELIQEVKRLELVGDDLTQKIFKELGSSFITPFDREDVHKLTSRIDNVVDFINSGCQKIRRYKPRTLGTEPSQLAEILLSASKEILKGMEELKNLKNPQAIEAACKTINQLEHQADEIYHSAISQLFATESDAVELIKRKEIIEAFEKATDRAEDVSDVLKTIIIKAA